MHLLGRLHGFGIKLVLCGRLREDYSTLLRVKAWFKDFPQDVFANLNVIMARPGLKVRGTVLLVVVCLILPQQAATTQTT